MNLRRDSLNKLADMSAKAFEYQRRATYIMQKTDDNMEPIGGLAIVFGMFTVNPRLKWQSLITKGYLDRKIEEIDGTKYVTEQKRKYPSLLTVVREMKKIIKEREDASKTSKVDSDSVS